MSYETPENVGIENQAETEPELQYIKVYRVRHGKSVYHEHYEGRDNISEDEMDLTPEGVQQIEEAGETIKSRIDPKRDLIVLISSPRRRAESAIKIIGSQLKDTFGEDVIQTLNTEDLKYKKRQAAIASVNLLDEKGEIVETNDPRYPKLFAVEAVQLIETADKAGMPTAGYLATHGNEQVGQFEKTDDLLHRNRTHLARLMLIARLKQPELAKQGKRLVIIQTEHNETLDEIYEKASAGKYSLKTKTENKKGTGAIEAEVVELLIPSDRKSNEIQVHFLGEGRDKDEKKVVFDPRTKEFES